MLDRVGYRGRAGRSPATSTRALDGADFVLIQIRVGGQAARLRDETLPLACGCIGQETTGAGGFAKALRTVPVVLDIAERGAPSARRRAPGSSTSRTRSGSSPARCSTPATARSGCATSRSGSSATSPRLLGVEPARVVVDQVGLNHLTWVRARAARRRGRAARRCWPSTATSSPTDVGLPRRLLDELGAVPSYYLHYFYAHDAVLAEQRDGATPRAPTVAEIERELLEMYRDPTLDEKPALLEQRGGAFYSEAAIGLVALARRRRRRVHVVDVRNDGTLAGLADDDVVEVPARVGRDGAGRRCRRRRSRPSCSGSSSTSPPTSGWPSRPRVTRRPRRPRARRCSRTR